MNYEEKVDRLVGLVLQAEESFEDIELIGDKDTIYDVALVLQDELGKDFFYECEKDDFEYLYANNDVLGIAITRNKDGVLYFLEEVFYGDITLESDNDTFYILEDVIDEINIDRLHGQIIVLKEFKDYDEDNSDKCDGDCEHCHLHVSEEENMFEVLADELLSSIGEYAQNDKELAYQIICDKLEEAYLMGKSDTVDEIQEKLYEI